ncbi:MAG: hypothetical protein WCX34_01490 [Syntrophales bacterium]|jgi:hypothetical protein
MTKPGFVHAYMPVGVSETGMSHPVHRLETLSGKRIGFLGNGKPNTDVLLETLAAELKKQFPIEALHFRKQIPSLAAPDELIAEIRDRCDAVVLAVGD